jgi:CDP-diacylglycerol--glycerol-3-phosphate 3-phosphatidyltransferase
VPDAGAVLLAVALLLAASMAVYAARGRRRDADAEAKRTRLLGGALDFPVHWFLWLLGPVERAALASPLTPDHLNVLGLLCGLASGLAIGADALGWGGLLLALGGTADVLDGRLARARGLASPYGAFVDSTLDRFVEVFAFLGFVHYLRAFAWGPLLATAAITGSLLVSYARARGESVGVLCKEGLMQRAERLVLTCLACWADGPLAARLGLRPGTVVLAVVGAIAALSFVTAAHRTLWIARRLRARG